MSGIQKEAFRSLRTRLAVSLESVADIVLYGHARFSMTYDYESINGRRIANPQVRATVAAAR
jgi:hypothetical protein